MTAGYKRCDARIYSSYAIRLVPQETWLAKILPYQWRFNEGTTEIIEAAGDEMGRDEMGRDEMRRDEKS